MWASAQLLPAPVFWFTRYLIVVPRPLFAAALVARRWYLIVVPRPMSAAARSNLIVVPRPLPSVPLVVHRRYLIAAPSRFPRRLSL
jgi:hypothetical protein